MNFNVTNQTFKGFSNPLSIVRKNDTHEMAFITVKLDNNGTNDLDQFKKLKEECKFSPADVENDVLIMTKVKNPKHGEFYSFDGLTIPNPENCKEDGEIRNISKKIYEYMYEVSKRIMSQATMKETSNDMIDVLIHSADEITRISHSFTLGHSLTAHAFAHNEFYKDAAKFFSENFKHVLTKFAK